MKRGEFDRFRALALERGMRESPSTGRIHTSSATISVANASTELNSYDCRPTAASPTPPLVSRSKTTSEKLVVKLKK